MECASYVGDVAGSGNGHHHRTGRGQSQMRYTPYDVPTGVLSPPPDYGKGQSQIGETDSWSGCSYSCILRINSFSADFKSKCFVLGQNLHFFNLMTDATM